MSNPLTFTEVYADCKNCFGLCCVALPFAKSADFPFDKDGGIPCKNLQSDYLCCIHHYLRTNGFRGCAVYDCFGAGQKVSKMTFHGNDWRENPDLAKEMFAVFPIMQQLHEMLRYLAEALRLEAARPIQEELEKAVDETVKLTNSEPKSLLQIDIPSHRTKINKWLLKTSELVRAQVEKDDKQKVFRKMNGRRNFIGAHLRGANLRGASLRGALLIAADLREADLSFTDFIGADLRDADLRGANLLGSIFLTQAQVNSANGDVHTKLSPSLVIPKHWKD